MKTQATSRWGLWWRTPVAGPFIPVRRWTSRRFKVAIRTAPHPAAYADGGILRSEDRVGGAERLSLALGSSSMLHGIR